ncbi:ABC transporter [Shewanella marisflavi]|uniref:ABC transporter n=1 Tax=Shewanella marisflavi TaxID=260364 RepID=A0AAC9XMC4_9GAMM|nr:ABC transporter ATP-binding protein [Shewanella marisflavi]ASJ95710.1 ABC transporter [Shewanella marisflavi]
MSAPSQPSQTESLLSLGASDGAILGTDTGAGAAIGDGACARPALSVRDLSWRCGERAILSGVKLDLPEGKMLGIIGPNGAGKSSLLRCLYRFLTPSRGEIKLFGQPIASLSARAFAREVAVVLQDTPQHFDMTTAQLVALGLTPHKSAFSMTTPADKQAVRRALETVGLSDRAGQAYESLSGGEKQRALIARAIVQRPKLLILDEPTNHLDIRYQIQILELLKTLGVTVVISIHDLNLASAMCDKLLLLDRGWAVAQGTPKQVLSEAQIANTFGVCCQVAPHPQHGNPQIHYFYGYYGEQAQSHGEQEANHVEP